MLEKVFTKRRTEKSSHNHHSNFEYTKHESIGLSLIFGISNNSCT